MKQNEIQQFDVELGARSYPILIGQGLLEQSHIADYINGNQALIVSNDCIAELYLDEVINGIRKSLPDCQLDWLCIAEGETNKTLQTYASILDRLMQLQHNRTTTLIALGGGIVGDITGFAAASFQRGVNFIQVPTTLLAQVDSSVGGKTGVNHPLGKNMIGAFYQPQAVIIDTNTLATLPDREFHAGLAEVIKYGLIRDSDFLDWLEDNLQRLMAKDDAALTTAINRSCRIKAEVVASDEHEKNIRAILNFGHTFGHAIESLTQYSQYLHGEAIAIGMVMAADFSQRLGYIDTEELERIKQLLIAMNLPVSLESVLLESGPQAIDPATMMHAMGADKKVSNGTMRFVILQKVGDALVIDNNYELALQATLRHFTHFES